MLQRVIRRYPPRMRYLLPTRSISKPYGQEMFCYHAELVFTKVKWLQSVLEGRRNCCIHRWVLWGIHKRQCPESHRGFPQLRSQLARKHRLHRNKSTTEGGEKGRIRHLQSVNCQLETNHIHINHTSESILHRDLQHLSHWAAGP